jgi:hypothetical protein
VSPRDQFSRLRRSHQPVRFEITEQIRQAIDDHLAQRRGTSFFARFLLGHTKIESMVRCLGIEVDDVLAAAEQIDV